MTDWQADWEDGTSFLLEQHRRNLERCVRECFRPAFRGAKVQPEVYLVLPPGWGMLKEAGKDALAFPALGRAQEYVREHLQGSRGDRDYWHSSVEILGAHFADVEGAEMASQTQGQQTSLTGGRRGGKLFLVTAVGSSVRRAVSRDPQGRLCYLPDDGDVYYEDIEGRYKATVMGVFRDWQQAEDRLVSETAAWWQRWLQAPWFSITEMASLPPELLQDLILDMGLVPPMPEVHDSCDEMWLTWWERTCPVMNRWQRERFLTALDLAPPFRMESMDLCE